MTQEGTECSSAALHQMALNKALTAAAKHRNFPSSGHDFMAKLSARECFAYVQAGVPCGEYPDYALRTFRAHDLWCGIDEIDHLFACFVQAGYIDPNRPVQVPPNLSSLYCGLLPLEAAAAVGCVDTFKALIDSCHESYDVDSIRAWISCNVSRQSLRDMLVSLVTVELESAMERRIKEASGGVTVNATANRQRRLRDI